MITPSFNLTATERVLPKLALDFTTASLDSRITFTRTTGASNPATYVNSSGYVTAATNNEPRFDYDPVTLACKGLLIEESRSNIITYSQALTTSPWGVTNTTVLTSGSLSPDGINYGFDVVENTASGDHALIRTTGIALSATTYSLTYHIRPLSGDRWFAVRLFSGVGNWSTVVFDPSTGQVTKTGNGASTIYTNVSGSGVVLNNGWVRINVTFTSIATTLTLHTFLSNSATPAFNSSFGQPSGGYTGNGTSGVTVWGAQLEAGAFATSYIPTTTTALTRNADVAVMTGTNFSSWFNASEGTLEARWIEGAKALGTTSQGVVNITDAAGNNSSDIRRSDASNCRIIVKSGGVNQATNLIANTAVTNQTVNGVLAYKDNSFATAFNASTVGTDTSGVVPVAPDRLILGGLIAGAQYALGGWLQKVNFYTPRVPDSNVQALSKV